MDEFEIIDNAPPGLVSYIDKEECQKAVWKDKNGEYITVDLLEGTAFRDKRPYYNLIIHSKFGEAAKDVPPDFLAKVKKIVGAE